MFDVKKALAKGAMLAPLAGFSDFAFRDICMECGASACVSEMISAKGLYYKDKKTKEMLNFTDKQRPFGIQLFGSDPLIMAIAADMVMTYDPDFIDINMGCPTPKITKNGDGSALMQNPKLAYEVAKAVTKATSVPVSVKIRAGYTNDNINASEVAKYLEDAGVSFLTIHGRTREQMYSPPVNLKVIEDVANAVTIPVVGNGDVKNYEDFCKMKSLGVCGVMIGRGAIGNPFLFSEIKQKLAQQSFKEVALEDKIEMAIHQFSLMSECYPEKMAVLMARSQLIMYFKGAFNASHLKVAINKATSKEEIISLLNEIKNSPK
ncbi:MAG: tRNA dihydrouridine synthase DusB [Clostridia bacterium]